LFPPTAIAFYGEGSGWNLGAGIGMTVNLSVFLYISDTALFSHEFHSFYSGCLMSTHLHHFHVIECDVYV